jgi:hypothetical protein
MTMTNANDKAASGNLDQERGDSGYLLVGCIVMIFVVLLTLSIAAPRIARQLEREKEVESAHRANEYVRALRVYHKKTNNYPGSIDQLKTTNNQKFLRKEFVDPLTGKADWRLIHVGENKTTVKGFFGADLPGLSSGLGSAASLSSGSSTGAPGSAFGSTGTGAGSTGSAFGGTSSGAGSTGSSFGSSSGSSGTSGSGGSNGITSQNATSATLGGGGPIMGIGSSKSGQAILAVNGEDQFQNWEFLYDPRIEQLYAKGAANGGISSGSATGAGSPGSSTGGAFGTGQGFGSNGGGNNGSGGSGFGGGGSFGGSGTPPTTPPGSGTTPPQ